MLKKEYQLNGDAVREFHADDERTSVVDRMYSFTEQRLLYLFTICSFDMVVWDLTFIVQWVIITLQLMNFLGNSYIEFDWHSAVSTVMMSITDFVTEIPFAAPFTAYILSTCVYFSIVGSAIFTCVSHHLYGWTVPLYYMRHILVWVSVIYFPIIIPHLKLMLPCLSYTYNSATLNPFFSHLTCWHGGYNGYFVLSIFVVAGVCTLVYFATMCFYNYSMPSGRQLSHYTLNNKYTAVADAAMLLAKTVLLVLSIAGHQSSWRIAMGAIALLCGVTTTYQLLWHMPYWHDTAMMLHILQALILGWTGLVSLLMVAFDDAEGTGMLYFTMLPVLLIAAQMLSQWRIKAAGDLSEHEMTHPVLVMVKIRYLARVYFQWLAQFGNVYIEASEVHDEALGVCLSLTSRVMELGVERFPENADVHLFAAQYYMFISVNRVLAYRSLTLAETTPHLKLEHRFRCRMMRSLLQAATAAEQSVEVRDYIEFKARRQAADRTLSQAMRSLMIFWTEVMQARPDIDKLATTGEHARSHLNFSIAHYERMLEINPQSIPVLRLYGVLCLEILGDVGRAQLMFQQADSLANTKKKLMIDYNYGEFLRRITLKLDIFDEENGIVGISINTESMGMVESVNAAFLRMLGYNSQNDFVGKNIDVILPEPIRTHHNRYMKDYLVTRQSNVVNHTRMVMALHATQGHLIPFAMYVRWSDEALGKIIAVLQPISNSYETCLIVDPATMSVTAATANFSTVFGYSRRDILAQRIKLFDVLPALKDDDGARGVSEDIYCQLASPRGYDTFGQHVHTLQLFHLHCYLTHIKVYEDSFYFLRCQVSQMQSADDHDYRFEVHSDIEELDIVDVNTAAAHTTQGPTQDPTATSASILTRTVSHVSEKPPLPRAATAPFHAIAGANALKDECTDTIISALTLVCIETAPERPSLYTEGADFEAVTPEVASARLLHPPILVEPTHEAEMRSTVPTLTNSQPLTNTHTVDIVDFGRLPTIGDALPMSSASTPPLLATSSPRTHLLSLTDNNDTQRSNSDPTPSPASSLHSPAALSPMNANAATPHPVDGVKVTSPTSQPSISALMQRRRKHAQRRLQLAINNDNARTVRKLSYFNYFSLGIVAVAVALVLMDFFLSNRDLAHTDMLLDNIHFAALRQTQSVLIGANCFIYFLFTRNPNAVALPKIFYRPLVHVDDSPATIIEVAATRVQTLVNAFAQNSQLVDNSYTNSATRKRLRTADSLPFLARSPLSQQGYDYMNLSLRNLVAYIGAMTAWSMFESKIDVRDDYGQFFVVSNTASHAIADAFELDTRYTLEEALLAHDDQFNVTVIVFVVTMVAVVMIAFVLLMPLLIQVERSKARVLDVFLSVPQSVRKALRQKALRVYRLVEQVEDADKGVRVSERDDDDDEGDHTDAAISIGGSEATSLTHATSIAGAEDTYAALFKRYNNLRAFSDGLSSGDDTNEEDKQNAHRNRSGRVGTVIQSTRHSVVHTTAVAMGRSHESMKARDGKDARDGISILSGLSGDTLADVEAYAISENRAASRYNVWTGGAVRVAGIRFMVFIAILVAYFSALLVQTADYNATMHSSAHRVVEGSLRNPRITLALYYTLNHLFFNKDELRQKNPLDPSAQALRSFSEEGLAAIEAAGTSFFNVAFGNGATIRGTDGDVLQKELTFGNLCTVSEAQMLRIYSDAATVPHLVSQCAEAYGGISTRGLWAVFEYLREQYQFLLQPQYNKVLAFVIEGSAPAFSETVLMHVKNAFDRIYMLYNDFTYHHVLFSGLVYRNAALAETESFNNMRYVLVAVCMALLVMSYFILIRPTSIILARSSSQANAMMLLLPPHVMRHVPDLQHYVQTNLDAD